MFAGFRTVVFVSMKPGAKIRLILRKGFSADPAQYILTLAPGGDER
jgi:hypothetical protein